MKKATVVIVIIALLAMGSAVYAQDNHENHHIKNIVKLKLELANKIVPFFLELNLSDVQKAAIHGQIHQVLTENKSEIMALLNQVDKHFNILEADVFDEGKFRASFQELAAMAEELAVAKARAAFEIKKVLSQEQLNKAIKLRHDVFEIVRNHIINVLLK